jgi:hypothetical protein
MRELLDTALTNNIGNSMSFGPVSNQDTGGICSGHCVLGCSSHDVNLHGCFTPDMTARILLSQTTIA